jgi:hypothetical protein
MTKVLTFTISLLLPVLLWAANPIVNSGAIINGREAETIAATHSLPLGAWQEVPSLVCLLDWEDTDFTEIFEDLPSQGVAVSQVFGSWLPTRPLGTQAHKVRETNYDPPAFSGWHLRARAQLGAEEPPLA